MSRKETPIDYSPIESGHSFLNKETLYNNDITTFTRIYRFSWRLDKAL